MSFPSRNRAGVRTMRATTTVAAVRPADVRGRREVAEVQQLPADH
ncbi:hypothetical protein RKD42_002166 [Streptomyces ambofaciens]|jgi:hypothetical protein